MRDKFFAVLAALSRWVGIWVVAWPARVIAACYFCFAGQVRRNSLDMYRRLMPDSSKRRLLWLTWRQFQSFTYLFIDQLRHIQNRQLSVIVEGREHVQQLQEQGIGAVLLMSHVGNWEVAAHLLADQGPRLMLMVGQRQGQEVEARQKEHLRQARVRVVQIAEGGGSPLDGLEALKWLREGGLVSMAGDVLWSGERTVPVRIMGSEVQMPAAPHNLALAGGVPVVVFFALRQADGSYLIRIHPPHWVRPADRSQRRQAVLDSAQHYAGLLEQSVRTAPEQWYWFESRFSDLD